MPLPKAPTSKVAVMKLSSRGRTRCSPPSRNSLTSRPAVGSRQAVSSLLRSIRRAGREAFGKYGAWLSHGWTVVSHPKSWALWTQPQREAWYLLSISAIGLATAGFAVADVPEITGSDWLILGELLTCATVHVFISRRREETWRNRNPALHIDIVSMWTFPGILLLPAALAILLIVLVRTQRWFTARRPFYRFFFSTATMVCGAALTRFAILEPSGITGAGGLRPSSPGGLLAVAAAGATYVGVQALAIALVIGMHTPKRGAGVLFGSRFDNGLEAFSITLGVVTAVLLVHAPALVVVMVLVGVFMNYVAEIRKLHMDARTDPKTNLLNMRGWWDTATRAVTRTQRSGGGIGLLMIDLDHFKAINDSWGHPAGDDMLEAVAGVLRDQTRPADVIGRFGGEEFVVLLPESGRAEAVVVGERILASVRQLSVITTDKRGGPAVITGRTTSIGIATGLADPKILDELLQAADAAVYEAKDAGRDRLRIAERDVISSRHLGTPPGDLRS